MVETEGIIGRKLGMTQVFCEDGRLEAVTAVAAGPCFVTQIKTQEKDGYSAVQLGFGEAKRLNSPEKGHLKTAGKQVKHLLEIRVKAPSSLKVGQTLDASLFQKGDRVDVIGISKGKGFAGGVKRYHFRGGPKTHGQSDRHRAPGSMGGTTSPARVYKGHRMAGHMGNSRVTALNVEIAQADAGRNIILLKGAVPGAEDSIVLIRRSVKSIKKK
jgi:large subunit ribosomal protein L3